MSGRRLITASGGYTETGGPVENEDGLVPSSPPVVLAEKSTDVGLLASIRDVRRRAEELAAKLQRAQADDLLGEALKGLQDAVNSLAVPDAPSDQPVGNADIRYSYVRGQVHAELAQIIPAPPVVLSES